MTRAANLRLAPLWEPMRSTFSIAPTQLQASNSDSSVDWIYSVIPYLSDCLAQSQVGMRVDWGLHCLHWIGISCTAPANHSHQCHGFRTWQWQGQTPDQIRLDSTEWCSDAKVCFFKINQPDQIRSDQIQENKYWKYILFIITIIYYKIMLYCTVCGLSLSWSRPSWQAEYDPAQGSTIILAIGNHAACSMQFKNKVRQQTSNS